MNEFKYYFEGDDLWHDRAVRHYREDLKHFGIYFEYHSASYYGKFDSKINGKSFEHGTIRDQHDNLASFYLGMLYGLTYKGEN